jgi:hypothetical protein
MMLRRIVPLSLAMTACATLIPTKVDAASLSTYTILPVGSLQRNPGDTIEFNLIVDPSTLNTRAGILIRSITFPPQFDNNELSFKPLQSTRVSNYRTTTTATIASLFFTVLSGVVKDGNTDVIQVNVFDTYEHPQLGVVNAESIASNTEQILDVEPISEPVPEPLTMFGAAAALGYGAILKRKYSKNTEA